jgi:hypothetical protein
MHTGGLYWMETTTMVLVSGPLLAIVRDWLVVLVQQASERLFYPVLPLPVFVL